MSLINLKRIARNKVRRTEVNIYEFEDYLKDWWSDKFKLPPNHPLLYQLTLEELIIMYYRDQFINDPKELELFEAEINEVPKNSDEAWFKKQMGKEYKKEFEYSTQFKDEHKKGKLPEKVEAEEFDDLYTFGGNQVNAK